jgi:hypothetical protein
LDEALIVHGVFDEAGDTGASPGSSRYLVVAGIVCSNLEPLRRIVAKTRKSLNKELRQIPELKAWHSPPKVVRQILNRLIALDVEIYAAILDKHSAKPTPDPEDWYRQVFAECVRLVIAYHPRLIVTLDRRYTKAGLRDELLRSIVSGAQLAGTTLSFVVADSRNEKALQITDMVAWSVFQKYARGEMGFFALIEEKVKGEVVLLR